MYQAKSGVKNFSLYWGGVPLQKLFFQSEHVSSQIWCQKIFPLLGGWGGPSAKNFFPVWTCIKPNLVSKIFPFTGGGPSAKTFFPVWTCIKPNLGSKIFPFTVGGSLCKNFFSSLNMYQAKSGVKNFSLYWGGVPLQKLFFQSEHVSSQIWCQKFSPL